MNIHQIAKSSLSNGPGLRAVIWTQGCDLDCQGCCNPESHSNNSRFTHSPDELAEYINELHDKYNLRGLTISGGEPTHQASELIHLISNLNPRLDILLFTGLSIEEASRSTEIKKLILSCDASLCGRFIKGMHPFVGKKLIITTERIKAYELKNSINKEIKIGYSTVITTGTNYKM